MERQNMAQLKQGMTLMPTISLSLGSHVIIRRKKDGTGRILFAVQNDRPSGWPPTIRLPLDGSLHDRPLDDPDLIRAAHNDAQALRQRLARERAGVVASRFPDGSMAFLADQWENMSNPLWSSLKPRTRRVYAGSLYHIKVWCASLGHPHVSKIQARHIREWLESGRFKPGFAMQHRRALSRLLSDAVESGIIQINPVSQMAKRKALQRTTKATVSRWTKEDVQAYASAAEDIGWIGGAILIRALWESPTRLYDVPLWTRAMIVEDDPLEGGVVAYNTSKSDGRRKSLAILSPKTMALVRASQSLFLVTRPDGVSVYEEGRDDDKLSYDFSKVRDKVVANGGQSLALRYLRHMSQTDAIRTGSTKEQIGVSSTHQDDAMLLGRYRQEDVEMARSVARKRGVIGTS
jgi:hypothetical protein